MANGAVTCNNIREGMTVELQDSLGRLLLHSGRKSETSQDDRGSDGIRQVSHDDTHNWREDTVSHVAVMLLELLGSSHLAGALSASISSSWP